MGMNGIKSATVGTYSTIYVASPILLLFEKKLVAETFK